MKFTPTQCRVHDRYNNVAWKSETQEYTHTVSEARNGDDGQCIFTVVPHDKNDWHKRVQVSRRGRTVEYRYTREEFEESERNIAQHQAQEAFNQACPDTV